MKLATLVLLRRDGHVWLGRKQTGEIGQQTWNAPGGKTRRGESARACAIRETWEEMRVRLTPELLDHVATIDFHAGPVIGFSVEVFLAQEFEGDPQPTAAMCPVRPFPITALPLSQMLEGDRDWFERAALGSRFCASVYYRERASGYLWTEVGQYRPLIE